MGFEKIVLLAAWGMAGRGKSEYRRTCQDFTGRSWQERKVAWPTRDGEKWTEVKVFKGKKH